MRGRRQGDGYAAKTRSEAGATPSRRKIAARSLRASGVTPASGCSGNRSPCFGRAEREQQRICKTARSTKPQGRNKKKAWQSSKHHPSNRRR
jgi:hypothetical protein